MVQFLPARHNPGTLRRWVHAITACLPLAVLAPAASAIQFDSFDAASHDRFLNNDADNPNFLLAGFDLSGIAKRGNSGSGAVLISPQHFITADHFKPASVNGSVTFRGTDGTDRSYTVTGYDQLTTFGDGSDLSIGTLAAPIDPFTDFINPLPIAFSPSIDDFIGLEVYTFGNGDLAGRNVIIDTGIAEFGSGDPRPSVVLATAFDTVENSGGDGNGPLTDGLGPDEAGLQGGDSGNAALTVIDGQLAVLGAHFGIASGLPDNSLLLPFSQDDPYFSLSTLMSPYLSQINAITQTDGQTFQTLTVTIPEPTTATLLLLGLTLTTLRRRSLHATS
ncbi:MAG: PEP-CTERM sorting domain-containing protein [Planctomycetota bacterium]